MDNKSRLLPDTLISTFMEQSVRVIEESQKYLNGYDLKFNFNKKMFFGENLIWIFLAVCPVSDHWKKERLCLFFVVRSSTNMWFCKYVKYVVPKASRNLHRL